MLCGNSGGGDDKAVVMVMCNRQEWLVDLVREPGKLLPLKPDTAPHQAPYLNRMSGHASGQSCIIHCILA